MTGVDKQRHFIRAMCKSADAESATQDERLLLAAILAALLRGEDVSDLIGIRRAHARRPSDPIRIAIHYLCLTKLMHVKAEAAWRTVGDAWGLKKREVQWVIADNGATALAMLPKFAVTPDTLLRNCERHARGVRPDRRRSGADHRKGLAPRGREPPSHR
ncbi:MAG: hypothetical protein IPJ97_17805 [Proteobacteria bacterium]|nr:hypothetical protein [Pseudomonadota bacterium]